MGNVATAAALNPSRTLRGLRRGSPKSSPHHLVLPNTRSFGGTLAAAHGGSIRVSEVSLVHNGDALFEMTATLRGDTVVHSGTARNHGIEYRSEPSAGQSLSTHSETAPITVCIRVIGEDANSLEVQGNWQVGDKSHRFSGRLTRIG